MSEAAGSAPLSGVQREGERQASLTVGLHELMLIFLRPSFLSFFFLLKS